MTRKNLPPLVALAVLAVLAVPPGRLDGLDTSIQVVRGVDRDCALNGNGTPACWDGTTINAGTTYDCRFDGKTVFCKVAEAKG